MQQPLYLRKTSPFGRREVSSADALASKIADATLTTCDLAAYLDCWFVPIDDLTRRLMAAGGELEAEVEWLRRFLIDSADHYDRCTDLILRDLADCGGDPFTTLERAARLRGSAPGSAWRSLDAAIAALRFQHGFVSRWYGRLEALRGRHAASASRFVTAERRWQHARSDQFEAISRSLSAAAQSPALRRGKREHGVPANGNRCSPPAARH